MSCVISKANIQLYFVNVSVQRRKAIKVYYALYQNKNTKFGYLHIHLYLHSFIGSNHKEGVPLIFLSLLSPFPMLQHIDNKSFMQSVKSDSK